MYFQNLHRLIFCVLFILTLSSSDATLLAWDGFAYTADDPLDGQSTPTQAGVWPGGWSTNSTSIKIGSSGLQGPTGYNPSAVGNSVAIGGGSSGLTNLGSQRTVPTTVKDALAALTAGGTDAVWGSLLMRLITSSSASLVSGTSGGPYINNDSTPMSPPSTGWLDQTSIPSSTSATLSVFKITKDLGGTFTLNYFTDVNPLVMPSTPTVTVSGVTINTGSTDAVQIGFFLSSLDGGFATFEFDEIRLGNTFQDVTTTPEPTSLLSIAFGFLGYLKVRRTRRDRARSGNSK